MADKKALERDLRALGVNEGSSLLVHAGFKALGGISGRPEAVIDALLAVIGHTGTLMMPGLCWDLRPPTVFDQRSTPVNVGIIPELFRQRSDTQRSLHPTHSMCAVGPLAGYFLDDHEQDRTPCGPCSPWQRLLDEPVQILMLGCGLQPNTSMHAIEERLPNQPYLGESIGFTMIDNDGREHQADYRVHCFSPRWRQRYDRLAECGPTVLQEGPVLATRAQLIQSTAMRDAVLERLTDDQRYFVDPV